MKLTKVFEFNFLILLGKYKKLKILSIEHRVGLPTKKKGPQCRHRNWI